MQPLSVPRPGRNAPGPLARLFGPLFLCLPAVLLGTASLRAPEEGRMMLLLGTAFQLLVCVLSLVSRQGWRQAWGPSVITLYVIGLGWLWIGMKGTADWFTYLAQAILLMVPLLAFGLQVLNESGATAIRRAQLLADRLASRRDLPSDLGACRALPELKAFREALHIDAAPALALLNNKRPEVQMAALCALEFRQNWRPGQAEMVLKYAQRTTSSAGRAAAVTALGNLDDQVLVETLAGFLRDSSWEVRRAAAEALLWSTEHRWAWIRHAVRQALADGAFENDGPLQYSGQLLPADAVADLTAWAAEKGTLSFRAALTLGWHYSRALNEQPGEGLVEELRRQLADPHTPPPLRMELARLLQDQRALDVPLLKRLLSPDNPAPLRLVAVEALLADEQHPEAVGALHELARLPNREIALATADVVQRRLGVDLGLDPGEPLPPLHSRQAAEITRRVLNWAAEFDLEENVDDSRPFAR